MGTGTSDIKQLDRIDHVLVSSGSTAKLHIPDDDGPICATDGEFRRKSLAVYPPAHRNWCQICRRLWIDAQSDGSLAEHDPP